MNGIFNFAKNHVIPAASAVGIMQYGLKHLPSQVNLLVGTAFNALPALGGFAPAIAGGVFFVVTRGCDAVANRIIHKKWNPSSARLENCTKM